MERNFTINIWENMNKLDKIIKRLKINIKTKI